MTAMIVYHLFAGKLFLLEIDKKMFVERRIKGVQPYTHTDVVTVMEWGSPIEECLRFDYYPTMVKRVIKQDICKSRHLLNDHINQLIIDAHSALTRNEVDTLYINYGGKNSAWDEIMTEQQWREKIWSVR